MSSFLKYIFVIWLFAVSNISFGLSYDLEITEQALQEKVSAMMPIEKKRMFVTVTLSDPQVDLLKDQNRIGFVVKVTASMPGQLQGSGRASVSGSVRYEPVSGAFYVDDPVVESFDVEKLPAKYAPMLKELSQTTISKALMQYPVYTLDESRFDQKMAKSMLESVEVNNEILYIKLKAF